jgi:hypothetical protein
MLLKSTYVLVSPKMQLSLTLLFTIVVDILIGVALYFETSLPVGILYRGLLYFIGIIVLIKKNKANFFTFFFLVWIMFFSLWAITAEGFSLYREITFFFKATYVFAILEIIKGVKLPSRQKTQDLIFILKRYAQIVASCILFSFFTGIGLETYGKWVFGTTSFFVAQNDIGVSQLLVFAFLLFNKKTADIGWLWLIMVFSSLILLGTTTGMFGSIAVLAIYIFVKLVLSKLTSVLSLFLRGFAVIFLGATIVVSSVLLINYIKSSEYYSKKYSNVLKEGVRSRLTNAGDAYFEERGLFINIFGEGFSSYTTNLGNNAPEIKHSKSNYKDWLLVETDYYDFIGAFGILLTLIFYSFYFYWLALSGINFYNKKTIYSFSLFLIFIMAMGHGYMAGHVFYSPTVMGIMAIVITLIMHQLHKRKEV